MFFFDFVRILLLRPHYNIVLLYLHEVPLKHDHYTHEYRFLHINGKYRWMRDELKLIRDDKDNPQEITCHKIARYCGYWIDVTERKEIEEALRLQVKSF